MLKMKTGNLIDAAKAGEVTVIAHCCNCMCNMGGRYCPTNQTSISLRICSRLKHNGW